MARSSVVLVQRILIAMVEQDGAPPSYGLDTKYSSTPNTSGRGKYVWQVRHSGLLGLKYLVAVKGDLLRQRDLVKTEGGDVKMEVVEDTKPFAYDSFSMLKGVVDAALLG
jgi:TATA-binding protein-associated factor